MVGDATLLPTKREFEITDEDLRFFTEYEEYLEKLKEADPEFKKDTKRGFKTMETDELIRCP